MSGLIENHIVGFPTRQLICTVCNFLGLGNNVKFHLTGHGCHASVKCQGNLNFFKIRDLSGTFANCQGGGGGGLSGVL